ncbi:MAG: heparin lyase I family protein [Deferrisomatales bacterium]|nr:heparin lyase I family protein [Deferrisomatales bacterium]
MKKCIAASLLKICLLFCGILVLIPGVSLGAIIWSGDFETGDFLQYHASDDPNKPFYWGFPQYCWPQQPSRGIGDGSCGEIVTSPVRHGSYAAKLTVKNSINGSEPEDCDMSGTNCTRRRSEVTVQGTMSAYYNGIPYMSERWLSVSYWVPSDWSDAGSGWGVIVMQIKGAYEAGRSGHSPWVELNLKNGYWQLNHRWAPEENAGSSLMPWQQNMFYNPTYPTPTNWPDGLADFPNVEASQAALASVNKGGWTDFIFHIKFDARGSQEGGAGFLKMWKREGSGSWVHILDIRPKVITRGGMTFDHGIANYRPPGTTHNGGFGPRYGMYMTKDQVWGLQNNRVLYLDNIKVGDENSGFHELDPEGGKAAPIIAPSAPPAFRKVQ